MTVSQKTALSLLISVVLAAVFSVLAFTGFFNLVETRFYNPSITKSLEREAARDADTIQGFLDELLDIFSETLLADPVKRSFLPNQAAQDIFERTRLYGLLLESQRGIQSVRFVDAGGLRIHFSTNSGDILSRSAETISYRNYDETSPYVPYPELAVTSGGEPKITLDQANERIIFSIPFYDSMEVYRGTVFYSVSIRAVADRLIAEGRIKIGENLSIVSSPPGMASGLPNSLNDAEAMIPVISSVWNEGLLGLTSLDSNNSSSALALISARTAQGLFVGRIVDEALFAFPQSMKVILVTAIFLTLFLSIFLALNLQPDTITVVQTRLKNLQLSLIREYYERKGEMDWDHWYRELEQRREDVRAELKRGIKEKPALVEDIDNLIDKSWDEILVAIGGKHEARLAIDEDKLQNILNRMLVAAGTTPAIQGAQEPSAASALMPFNVKDASAGPAGTAEEVLEELGEEEVEELGSESEIFEEDLVELAEPSEAEDLEELSDMDAEEVTVSADLFAAVSTPAEQGLPETDEIAELDELEELEEIEAAPLESAGEMEAIPSLAASKKSNIELVFGEDDIPTIVESSGLELVDDLLDLDNKQESPAEELEDLEEMEDLDDLEELESAGSSVSVSVDSFMPSANFEPDVASKIEFESISAGEEEEELDTDNEFVIVSPFSSMLSRFDDSGSFKTDDEESKKVKTSGRLEELNADYSMSLVYKPFHGEDKSDIQELPVVGSGVIKQKNGVHYVDGKAKKPDQKTTKTLDPGLKNLVDSVISKK